MLRKTEALQKSVERYYSDLAERASDTLGNVALVQSFTRVEDEVRELRAVVERLLGAQIPVLSWWAVVSILTQASTTLTMLAILILGSFLFARGLTTIGEIVTFMGFAGMLIQRLEQAVCFVNSRLLNVPRLDEFFDVLDTTISVKDRQNAVTLKTVRGEVEFDDVTFSYDGKRSCRRGPHLHGRAGRDDRAGRRDRRRQIDRAGAALPRLRSAIGQDQDRRPRHPRHQAREPQAQYRRDLPGAAAVQPLDRRESARRQS